MTSTPLVGEFKKRFKKYRKELKLSQYELGQKIRRTQATISKWENMKDKRVPNLYDIEELVNEWGEEKVRWLLSLGSEQKHKGITWVEQIPANFSEKGKKGIDLFNQIVINGKTTAHISESQDEAFTCLRTALLSRAISFSNVDRDSIKEQELQTALHEQLKECIVAKTETLPNDDVIDATIRVEAVAFLAAHEAIKSVKDVRKVGLTGGTIICRFVDLIQPYSLELKGVNEWVALVAFKTLVTAVGAFSSNSAVTKIVDTQEGIGQSMPFIEYERRESDEINVFEARHCVRRARQVKAAFIGVGSRKNYESGALGNAMPELMDLIEQLPARGREQCKGDILLQLVDGLGKRVGESNHQQKNDALRYGISCSDLKGISSNGPVWILSTRREKAPVILGSLIAGYANRLVITSEVAEDILNLTETDQEVKKALYAGRRATR
jgi:DNA-binding transcriptional regulator LsrR (DeoR family)